MATHSSSFAVPSPDDHRAVLTIRALEVDGETPEELAGRILLGGRYRPTTFMRRLREGLPVSALDRLVRLIGNRETILALSGISARTYLRRKQDKELLDPVTSDRLYRVAHVVSEAVRVFEDDATAIDWLQSPNRSLGSPPVTLLDTEIGANQVLRTLGRIEYSVYE